MDVLDQEDAAQGTKIVKRLILTELKRQGAQKVQIEMEVWKPGVRIKEVN